MGKIGTFVSHRETPEKTEGINTKIDRILFHLYGFNLGFAAEKNMHDIRDKVTEALTKENGMSEGNMHAVAGILTDEKIQETANKYSEYKMGVEERAANTPKIHD